MIKRVVRACGIIFILILVITGCEIVREEFQDVKLEHGSFKSKIVDDEFAMYHSKDRGDTFDTECYFSGVTSRWIDHVLYRGSKYWIRKPVSGIAARVMSITIFPLSAFVDSSVYSVKGVYESIRMISSADDIEKHAHKLKMSMSFDKAKRTFLGAITSPVGLISPDLVSQHFIREKLRQDVVKPYGSLYSAKALVVQPETIEDVQNIVTLAKIKGKSISFAGAMMSQGKQALPAKNGEVLMDFSKMNRISIDPEQKVATVGAGVTWGELQNAVNEYGLAVKVMQASNVFSVGGSLSANCHGWDHHAGSLVNTVHSLTVVCADGELKHLSPDDELFGLVIGGYGCFGAIVEAELSLANNDLLGYEGVEVQPNQYLDYFNNHIDGNDEVALHYYRLSLEPKKMFKTGVAVNYVRNGRGPVTTTLVDEPVRGNKIERIELQILRRLQWSRKLAWSVEKKSALEEYTLSRNEAMRPPINSIFNNSKLDTEWLQEYFVKKENLSDFLNFLSGVLQENKVPVFNASVRFVKQDSQTSLPYAKGSDRFAVVLFFNQSLLPEKIEQTRLWVKKVIDYLNDHDGTYYLPYQHFSSREQFHKSYPEWENFVKMKDKYDPQHRFQSGFFEEYLAQNVVDEPVHVMQESKFRKVFSSQQGRDGIRDFLNNVFMQMDDDAFFSLIDSILGDDTLSDEQIYQQLSLRISEAAYPVHKKFIAAYRSLGELQEALSEQVSVLLGDQKINGYIEIGYPGRLIKPIKKKVQLSGPVYVINESETLMDYIESGFPRPYDRFVPLNFYNSIREEDIPTGSVDLVTCFIGLHHIPKEKLVPFIRSINRVLRPGGTFILMDHDAYNEDLIVLDDVVHSVFNAGTGVSEESERNEYRNFQSLNYWTEMLTAEGFNAGDALPMIRDGDPTLNSTIKFTKPVDRETEIIGLFKNIEGSERPGLQTYLTAPEWYIVHSSQAYAEFIEHTPFYEFPFFSEIYEFWNVLGNSWNAARKHYSFWEVATSEYLMMDLFIGVTTTIEYTFKGILSAPLNWVYTSEKYKEAETIHVLIDTHGNDLPETGYPVLITESYPNSTIMAMEVPRYKPFTRILTDFSLNGIDFINIAGHSYIQLDTLSDNKEEMQNHPLPKGCVKLYDTPVPANASKHYTAYDVEVKSLGNVLRFFESSQEEILYIHDY